MASKIFFSIASKRLTNFLLNNNCIDTSLQKGSIPGVPGCIEHTGVVTQLIREVREGRGDRAVLWLDLTNAYGSVPHKLIKVALDRHHVPQKVKGLILDYYSKFRLRASFSPLTSDWHQLEGLEKLVSWAHMSFKPAKSRSLVLKKGKVTDKFHFRLREDQIPSVMEKRVKAFLSAR